MRWHDKKSASMAPMFRVRGEYKLVARHQLCKLCNMKQNNNRKYIMRRWELLKHAVPSNTMLCSRSNQI